MASMTAGKRRRPLLNASRAASAQNVTQDDLPSEFDEKDDVESFVAKRHARMAGKDEADDSDSDSIMKEPEAAEHDVLKLDLSDSDASDDDEAESTEDEEKMDWGGKKHNWYGGETHEYEIMEDDEREELLKDEEEEVIRLQNKALNRSLAEDYLHDEDEFDEMDPDEEDDDGELDPDAPALDPDSVGVDLRTHPVLTRIIQTRSLLQKAASASTESPANTKSAGQLDQKETKHRKHQGRAEIEKNRHALENGVVNENSATAGNGMIEENGVTNNNVSMNENDALTETGLHKKHKKDKREKKRRSNKEKSAIAEDEQRIHSLLQPISYGSDTEEDQTVRDQKRRKLNKIVGAMERDRKNNNAKRMAPADLDIVRDEARTVELRTNRSERMTRNEAEERSNGLVDDEEVMSKMLAKKEKKEERKAKKAASSAPHVYTFKDEVRRDGKRKASYQVIHNRGLTRYRPRDKKTPRTKNRLAYGKAVVRRKGAVREYAGANGGSYGGEASGINMSARKSSKLG